MATADVPTAIQEYFTHAARLHATLGLDADALPALRPIGQGEYNENFAFTVPADGRLPECADGLQGKATLPERQGDAEHRARTYVLRVNHGSQMHLSHQIAYEFDALKLLEPSGRTPAPYYCDDGPDAPGDGALVMSFLPGRALDYATDLDEAARIFADIHSIALPPNHGLVAPHDTLGAIIEESRELYGIYANSALADAGACRLIGRIFDAAERAHDEAANELSADPVRHIVNTEVNSTNFLIRDDGAPGALVDWEKPIAGQAEQDIADFLAPTATFWKTDVILERAQMDGFLSTYREAVGERFDLSALERRFSWYLPVICLRGVTWCAMAQVEYADPARPLRNESTAAKIEAYLSRDFLEMVIDDLG